MDPDTPVHKPRRATPAVVARGTVAPIVINGRVLTQPVTGVQRVAREILAVLDAMAASGEIAVPEVLLPAHGDLVAPMAFAALVPRRVGHLGGHAWEQGWLPQHCRGKTLICLGNTAPVAALLARRTRVVSLVHDLSYRYFPGAYDWRFRALYAVLMPVVLHRSDRVVTVSQAERDAIGRTYPALARSPRLQALQNGGLPDATADAARQAPAAGWQGRDYGLYVGSLSQRKNAQGVLRAAIRFLRSYPQMRFRIVGATSAVFSGIDLAVPPDLADRLEFLGQIDDPARIHTIYRGARFLLFPSFYEASPLPPIEAMTLGCPVIAAAIPSLTERCGDAALYCDPSDDGDIAARIDALMTDPALWHRMATRGRAVSARYSWRAQTAGILALCEAPG